MRWRCVCLKLRVWIGWLMACLFHLHVVRFCATVRCMTSLLHRITICIILFFILGLRVVYRSLPQDAENIHGILLYSSSKPSGIVSASPTVVISTIKNRSAYDEFIAAYYTKDRVLSERKRGMPGFYLLVTHRRDSAEVSAPLSSQ